MNRKAATRFLVGAATILLMASACTNRAASDPKEPREPLIDEVERAFATVTFIADVTVNHRHAEAALPGASSFTVTIDRLVWEADGFWDLSNYKSFDGPQESTELRLAADDAWSLSEGDSMLVAVTTLTRPTPHIDGYIRLVAEADGSVWEADTRLALGLAAYVADGAEISGEPQRDTIIQLVEDGREWIDRVNRRGGDEMPAGLLRAIAARNERAN